MSAVCKRILLRICFAFRTVLDDTAIVMVPPISWSWGDKHLIWKTHLFSTADEEPEKIRQFKILQTTAVDSGKNKELHGMPMVAMLFVVLLIAELYTPCIWYQQLLGRALWIRRRIWLWWYFHLQWEYFSFHSWGYSMYTSKSLSLWLARISVGF